MKITLNNDDSAMARLKREAVRQGRTVSELMETALYMFFKAQREEQALAPIDPLR